MNPHASRRSRRDLLLGASFALAPSLAVGQGRPGDSGTAQEILGVREKLRAAVVAKDRAALDALYDPSFMHLRDSGRADLKAERISLVLAGESTIETAPEEQVAVQAYGPATAVATGVSRITDRATGRSAPFRWLVVYVRAEDGWRVAVSQASRVPARAR